VVSRDDYFLIVSLDFLRRVFWKRRFRFLDFACVLCDFLHKLFLGGGCVLGFWWTYIWFGNIVRGRIEIIIY
jgi:hypothetical protein